MARLAADPVWSAKRAAEAAAKLVTVRNRGILVRGLFHRKLSGQVGGTCPDSFFGDASHSALTC